MGHWRPPINPFFQSTAQMFSGEEVEAPAVGGPSELRGQVRCQVYGRHCHMAPGRTADAMSSATSALGHLGPILNYVVFYLLHIC
jgi:hypothetical protein